MKKKSLFKFVCFSPILIISVLLQGAESSQQSVEMKLKNSFFDELEWRCIGPSNMGGRIDDISVVQKNPHIIYVGTASGGLWKTFNNGITWEPIFDEQGSSSIGDVAVSPSHPDIVWVGTGEANNRQSSSWGDGVYKSTDGGRTWQNMGLNNSHHVGRIIINPTDPDIVYAAALGHLWGPNRERGLFKTEDGGKTWTNVLYINENTGIVDVAMDPINHKTLYAAAYQRRRRGWGFSGGGEGSGLYKSTNGGESWIKLTDEKHGLPTGSIGRIGIDIYRSDPNILYVILEHKQGGVFRSEDKGLTWEKMSDINPRPMYYSQIRIDPNNDQRIWVLGGSMHVSEDGGKTFSTDIIIRYPRRKRRVHSDQHALWINPQNSNHMILGNDGGIYISYDRGMAWDFVDVLPIGQYYEISYDMRKPYYIYGGLQDNGCWGGPSASWDRLGITKEKWFKFGGGDGFYTQVDPNDQTLIYGESQHGSLFRFDLQTGLSEPLKPKPNIHGEGYRFNWNSPFLISPHDSDIIYLGGNRLFISKNRGESWEATKDLTKQLDKEKIPVMGVLLNKETLSRDDGIPFYGTITTISESPIKKGLLYVGTDDGNIQISKDGGKSWKNASQNITGVPKSTYVSRLTASNHSEERAYAAFDNHRNDDFNPYVFLTMNCGNTWVNISSNLPSGGTVNVIREHPNNPNLLIVGTERGAFFSLDRGNNWMKFNDSLPIVPVDDIAIHPRENDLIFGTHGRSIWILDDITPLEQLTDDVISSPLHLFDIRPTTMFINSYGNVDFFKGQIGHNIYIAPNPPYGAIINYYLKETNDNDVSIIIRDSSDKKIREITDSGEQGINRVVWNLKYTPPDSSDFSAPSVIPGSYQVTVKTSETEIIKSVEIEKDPKLEASCQSLKAQHDALLQIYQLYPFLSSAESTLNTIENEIKELGKKLKKISPIPQKVLEEVNTLVAKIEYMQDGQNGKSLKSIKRNLLYLYRSIERVPEFPSEQQIQQIKENRDKLADLINEINKLIETDIPRLNKILIQSETPHLNPRKKIDVIR